MQAAQERVSKGLSIHVGLNSVGAAHYAGWSCELVACGVPLPAPSFRSETEIGEFVEAFRRCQMNVAPDSLLRREKRVSRFAKVTEPKGARA